MYYLENIIQKMYFRFLDIKTLPSTRSYHQFIPIHETLVGAKRISEQVDSLHSLNLVVESQTLVEQYIPNLLTLSVIM